MLLRQVLAVAVLLLVLQSGSALAQTAPDICYVNPTAPQCVTDVGGVVIEQPEQPEPDRAVQPEEVRGIAQEQLPQTGSDAAVLALVAAGLLTVGTGTVVLARRRRRTGQDA